MLTQKKDSVDRKCKLVTEAYHICGSNYHKSHIKPPRVSKGELDNLKGKTEDCCYSMLHISISGLLSSYVLSRQFITLPDYYMHVSGWVVYTVNHIQLWLVV